MTNPAGPEFVLGGNRFGPGVSGQGVFGDYWANTTYSSNSGAYYVYFNINQSAGYAYYYKFDGMSLRCLAKGRTGSSFSFPPTPSTNYSLTPLDQTLC